MKSILVTLLALAAVLAPVHAARKDNTIPRPADAALQNAKEIILLSLLPFPEVKTGGFHGFKILGQTTLAGKPCATAEAALRAAFDRWDGAFAGCFNPRHGIRIKAGDAVFDFVICFECESVLVFQDERLAGSFGIVGKPGALDTLLTAAGVPLAPPAE